MILLNDEVDYYIIVDGQGGSFGGGRICEGVSEVFEQFGEWGDMDDVDITDYSLSDLMEIWGVDVQKYSGTQFHELNNDDLKATK